MSKIVSVINSKGGVGKTTTVVNLAHALAIKGQKILVCDLDPQASASVSLGFRGQDQHPSIAEVVFEELPAQDAVKKTSIEGLDILTGSMALASFDITFADTPQREYILKNALSEIKDNYDAVIIDCSPTLGLLSVNALVACNEILVPVIPQYLSLEGLATLTSALERIKAGMSCKAEMMGILLTQVDSRSKAVKEIVQLIREHYGQKVFNTEIKASVRLSEAPSFGQTIFQHDWASSGAMCYQSLADEVISYCQK